MLWSRSIYPPYLSFIIIHVVTFYGMHAYMLKLVFIGIFFIKKILHQQRFFGINFLECKHTGLELAKPSHTKLAVYLASGTPKKITRPSFLGTPKIITLFSWTHSKNRLSPLRLTKGRTYLP